MKHRGRSEDAARWPRSARATCAALTGIVVVLALATATESRRSSGSARNAVASATVTRFATAAAAAGATRTGHVQSADVSASAMPVPAITSEQAMVGPLFRNGLDGVHSCTATVVASSQGDTVLTAAHCLSGSARGWLFVPGYERGSTPEGVWTVTGQYVDAAWLKDQSAADDFAVLTVADRTIDGRPTTLASVTGAAQLAQTPTAGTMIRVIGYNAGRNDPATTCVVPLELTHGHPTFYCHGFVGGSSGSPWLLAYPGAPTIVGVIGGRHQGGCTEYTSHSSEFTSSLFDLLISASGQNKSDDIPSGGSGDNCSTP